jgi:DNA segregation ATPase FtsK/SpoIIIE-like protein
LYKIKIRLKRHGEVTINNLEEYREVIESVVERPIKFEIVDYKNIYVNVLYLDSEKGGEVMVEHVVKYEYYPVENGTREMKSYDNIKYTFIEGEKEGVKACIGYDLEGNLKVFDILEGNTLVGGTARWGKSNFLNTFVTSIMKSYTPNEVYFFGCDFKKADIYYFRRYKHFMNVSTNKQEFLSQLNTLDKIMKSRTEILDEANCRNVISYNKKHDKKMSYVIFIIDELVQLTKDAECRNKLHQVMSISSSYGIYFILASQDCTKETVGKCKMNCSQIVGFHTFDETDSNTLIGKDHNLKDITIRGRCKIKNSEGVIETQIMYLDEDEIDKLLKDNIKQ